MLNWLRSFWDKGSLGIARSGEWRAVRNAQLSTHPICEACGKNAQIAHHIIPFVIDRTKELDPKNIISLCNACHFFLAHLKNFKHYNPEIQLDAKLYRSRIKVV